MSSVANCVAQSYTSFSVRPTSDNINTTSGYMPQNIYAVDVNNDGIPDLIQDYATANGTAGLGGFGISIANGDGTFRPTVFYRYPPGVLLSPMAFGDFNGDGKVDIAMEAGGRTIAIYLGNGDGTFVNPWYSTIPLSSGQTLGASAIVAADFNHDRKLDLAVVGADSTNTTIYVLPGAGTGLFSSANPILTVPNAGRDGGTAVASMVIGDFDSDTQADIALTATTADSTGGFASSTIHVLYGAGNFTFEDTTPLVNTAPVSIGAGDLNSDGYTDIYGLDDNGLRLYTLYGQPGRLFADYTLAVPPTSYRGGSGFMPTFAMADFNDDGRMDLVTTVGQSAELYMVFFLAGPNPGEFTTQTWNITSYTLVPYPTMPVAGDFNHDNKPDFAFVNSFGPGNSTIYTGLNVSSQGLWSNCDYPTTGRGIHVCSPDVSSGAAVNFNATSNSYGALRKMELWVDGKKLAEQHHSWAGNSWFSFSSALAPGNHQGDIFSADVDDTLQLASFKFTIPSTCAAPTSGVHICAPAIGSTTSTPPVMVQATSTVTGTLARMEVWVDSTKKYTDTDSNFLSASIAMTAGKHTITVFAVNTSGTVWSSAATVTVP